MNDKLKVFRHKRRKK